MNRVCEILGCSVPIIEGGLAYVGNGQLAQAVSSGGGFGQVGAGGHTPESLERELGIAFCSPGLPIGVNLPISEHRDVEPILRVIEAHADRLRAVSLSAGNPRPFIERLHERGLRVIVVVSTPEQAVKAEKAGADVVVCEGTEAGGHNGPGELTTLTLCSHVVDAVQIPVIAAGGIADGRGIASALCLGVEGVQMGTRFVATEECIAHENYKRALVEATFSDTRIMERSFGRVTRVLKGKMYDEILELERTHPGNHEVLWPFISGRKNEEAAIRGEVDRGWLNCGQSVGHIHSIQPAHVVIQELWQSAMRVLQATTSRVSGIAPKRAEND